MVKNEDSGSPSWSASLFMQTKEDVARAVAAAAAAATTVRSPRPSVVFSSKDDNGNSPLHKLQHQVSRVLKGFSQPPEVKSGTYNPEVLTSQKRQWASVQLQSLDHRPLKEPSRLFESMVVVGLHPNCDIQALQKQYFGRKSEGSGKFRSAFSGQHQSRVEPNLEPQVLFVYPPEKQLPLKYKDLLSFCFPGGVEVHAIEKTSSMSELNEILLGQDHLKQSDLSFVFRLQVADDSTLYGCCVLVEEIVQKPSGLISMISDGQPPRSGSRRHMLTTRRCYCILSRFPFFELHFSVLKSIFTEERLERLTKGMSDLDLESSEGHGKEENLKENSDGISSEDRANDVLNGTVDTSQLSPNDSLSEKVMDDVCHMEHQMLKNNHLLKRNMNGSGVVPVDPAIEKLPDKRENGVTSEISEAGDTHVDDFVTNKQLAERRFPNAVLPLLRYQQYESSESSSSFQGSPSEDRIFRSDLDEVEIEEASFSGEEYSSDHSNILDWAKGNNHGSLQIICEYYRLPIPARGSTIMFHPLEHLHPLEFHRPDETVLHIAGSTIDLKSCSSSLELAEAHSALMAEEEAKSLSVWAVALLCGSLRLENVLTLFAGALLEKQIVVISSNLGILSALVLSIIPLIRPYQWQSLLMPVLPNDMLDFLDAPVPYVVGVKNKTTEVQSKLTNAILVDANKNQVRSPTIPQLPQQKELYSYLIPYHAKLVGESFLGRKRPVYECTDAQRLYPRQLGSCQSLSTSAILYGNNNNFDFKTVFRSGGFPSTHSSVMNTLSPPIHSSAAVATAMSLGFERGLSDAVFGLAVVYASLIMYDAQGMRREVGIHAKALNRVLLQNSASSNDADDLIDSQPRKSSSNSESFGPLFLEEADTFQAKQTNAKLLLRSENRKSQSGILISSSLASDVEGESKKIANSWAMLKETVGHNEIEVIASALLGLFVSFAVYTLT